MLEEADTVAWMVAAEMVVATDGRVAASDHSRRDGEYHKYRGNEGSSCAVAVNTPVVARLYTGKYVMLLLLASDVTSRV
jgi:hypothetical protein